MGRILYFPKKSLPIDQKMLHTKVLSGQAYLVSVFWYRGGNCHCYCLEHDNEITYVFDVRPDARR